MLLDMLAYGMMAPVDGKSKPMHLVYRDELFRCAGPPEYMSPTALCRVIHKDSAHNATIEEILKNMMVPSRPRGVADGRYSSFSNMLECK